MYKFSDSSLKQLLTCDYRLQLVAKEVIKLADFKIICGHRSCEAQEQAFKSGASKLEWPNSKHNKLPSLAYDFVPMPLDWKNLAQFAYISGLMIATGFRLGIRLRSGLDWNVNGAISDEKFMDAGHLELIE